MNRKASLHDPAARARADLERAMRDMFHRWGEWRSAQPEDRERAKSAIATAEGSFEEARDRLDRILRVPLPAPPAPRATDLPKLRETLHDLERALTLADVRPDDAARLLDGTRARDTAGRPIRGLEEAIWRHERVGEAGHVWTLADAEGHTYAVVRRGASGRGWETSVWNEAIGDRE